MEASTHIYPINNLDDLAKVPDWVFESLNYHVHPYKLKPRLINEITTFIDTLFEQRIDLSEEIRSMSRGQFNPLVDLINEQRQYLFGLKWEESKQDLLDRHLRIERLTDEQVNLEDGCNVWFVGASINDLPYGGIFVFQQVGSSDLMIQGISKFIVPGVLSMLRPDLASKLPKLNSLLIPAIETIGQNVDAKRIIVNPIGAQGHILETHYGFYPIESLTPSCEIIRESWGSEDWLARDLD